MLSNLYPLCTYLNVAYHHIITLEFKLLVCVCVHVHVCGCVRACVRACVWP